MIGTERETGYQRYQARRGPPARLGVVAGVLAAAVVIVYGGYGHHWSWTGINGRTATLWDWLHLLLLPVAVGVLPIWLSRSTRLHRSHKLIGVGSAIGFAVLVIAGYTIPWGWTGFAGNRLWDWLELLALPFAVALAPIYPELRENWTRRHSLALGAGLAVFAAIVLGGYLGHWHWTGFRGNTLWDWLHLLLLPLLIPLLVVPLVKPMATTGIAIEDDDEEDSAPTVQTGAPSSSR